MKLAAEHFANSLPLNFSSRNKATATIAAALLAVGVFAQRQNPFAPPSASLHYALDRTCDLQHLRVNLTVDYANKAINGVAVNKLAALRNGLTEITLHAGTSMQISAVKMDGKAVRFAREDRNLKIFTGPLAKGKPFTISISYLLKNKSGGSFGAGGGWHWINPTATDKNRVGFWTQGESEYNSEWVPTWDYPNDFATSETHTTVQADWNVIGNGVLESETLSKDKKSRTYVWRMTQPHATYLLSLCGGPFDIKKDVWEGVELWYVTPRGWGDTIADSFGHTKDMLGFFSKVLGTKYAWPKYAQNAMWDFGGGMENVSSTTLGAGSLTDWKDGYFNMDSLNSHELAHQWFGDLVTCKDWSDTWLNESFATFMEGAYMEHSRGLADYQYEVSGNIAGYLAEARRYKRPISSKMYPNADAMFDSHTYPKGGAILHTLRRQLGDENFWAGLNYYLTKWRHTPVESAQLRRAFTEATGINVEPFWAQWIEKPGHPVLDYSWVFENGRVKLTVKQAQNTDDGTPIYDLPTKVDFISATGRHNIQKLRLSKTEELFEFSVSEKPGAVVLDPDLDMLREIPQLHWSSEETAIIAQFARSAPDRQNAFNMMLREPNDQTIALAAKIVTADSGQFPQIRSVDSLFRTEKESLRALWISQLEHKNFERRRQAVLALARLPKDAATVAKFRSIVTDKSPTGVVTAAINALAEWDAKGNVELFKAATKFSDRRGAIKRTAERAIEKAKSGG